MPFYASTDFLALLEQVGTFVYRKKFKFPLTNPIHSHCLVITVASLHLFAGFRKVGEIEGIDENARLVLNWCNLKNGRDEDDSIHHHDILLEFFTVLHCCSILLDLWGSNRVWILGQMALIFKRLRFFMQTDPAILFLFFFGWGHALVVMGFFFSSFISSPRAGWCLFGAVDYFTSYGCWICSVLGWLDCRDPNLCRVQLKLQSPLKKKDLWNEQHERIALANTPASLPAIRIYSRNLSHELCMRRNVWRVLHHSSHL